MFLAFSNFSKITFWNFQKYSLRNPRKFADLGDFDIFRTNCWNNYSEKNPSKLVNFGPELQWINNILRIKVQKCETVWRNLPEFLNAERCRSVLFSKRRISVNLVDLVKSFQTSIYYLLAKFGVDTAENGPPKVCQKLDSSFRKKLEVMLEKIRSNSELEKT